MIKLDEMVCSGALGPTPMGGHISVAPPTDFLVAISPWWHAFAPVTTG